MDVRFGWQVLMDNLKNVPHENEAKYALTLLLQVIANSQRIALKRIITNDLQTESAIQYTTLQLCLV